MSEISSSIKITDEFSAPLKELVVQSWECNTAVTAVAKSLVELNEDCESIADVLKKTARTFKNEFVDDVVENSYKMVTALSAVAKTTTNVGRIYVDAFKGNVSKDFRNAFASSTAKANFKLLGNTTGDIFMEGVHGALSEMRWQKIYDLSTKAFNKLKDDTIKLFGALQNSINQSLDEITISEKLEGMWGNAGKVAKRRAYELANEIGESATMVTELAGKAAYEGIGTEQFERMMRLADKVSKLKPGETVESAASTLMSDLKSGHSAGTVAQMFGGGEVMERQLKRAGYERALNRGDVDKALEIAEKIAEQAGLTNEKYNDAYSNMSQNFKRIFNVIDNVKKRLGETFNRSFAPTVAKVKDFVTSEKFQTVVNIFDKIVGLVGKIANWFTEGIINNIEWMGILLGVAGIAKLFLIINRIKAIIGMSKLGLAVVKLFRGPLGWIIGGLGRMIKHLIAIGVKQSLIYLKSKAMAALKVAGPWLIAAAAIGIALKVLHHLFGEGKTFTEFIMGGIAAGYQLALNAFMNVLIFFSKIGDKIHVVFLTAKMGLLSFKQTVMQNIGQLLKWLVDNIAEFIEDSGLGTILSALGIDIGGIASSASDWFGDMGKAETEAIEKISKQIEGIKMNELEYIDIMQGVKEAYDSNGETVKKFLSGLFASNKKQEEDQDGIAGNTDKIRKMNEQEEELRWMKAFSDRQIMSSYNSMTSNVRNININGMSQAGMIEVGRRSLSTMPSRSMM